ncbi:MAG TPA: rhamnulokinase family protein [Jiangellaceae bacterium]
MSSVEVAAVDLGASSGRVMVGRVGPDALELVEAHRFPNIPVDVLGTLHWDILRLYRGVLDGLREAGRLAPGLASVGIDSWAVDYGLLDERGALLGNPVHYRDGRTGGIMEKVLADVAADELYQTTGLQRLPFNTIYQLVAESEAGRLDHAETLLMIPDLIAYWLTGESGAEVTNASTTQLFDVRARTWAGDLIERLRLPRRIFPELREPGAAVGGLVAGVREHTGLPEQTVITAIGSHDTASAVVAVPARGERFAYISCGTWSLVGLELDQPVLTEASRLANFTNEAGVDGRIRYLRNVMGLWLLQECVRTWELAGQSVDLQALLEAAAAVPPLVRVIDPDDAVFLPPGDMPARIAEACARTGQPVPESQEEIVRCIIDSLAIAYRRTVRQAAELAGREVDVIHLVGGGAQNALLCQLTADACGLPVLAGPVEATALGNVLVQGRALGAVDGDLDTLRALVAKTQQIARYEPGDDETVWAVAERRLFN